MSQTKLNSRCFTLTALEKDPEIGEELAVLTLRQNKFPHTPVILTATEVQELRYLLDRWSKTGPETEGA